jgi:hypothetical protein
MSSADWSQSPARGPGAAARMAPVKGEWGNSEEGFWEGEATGHVYLGQVGAPEGPGTERSARKPRVRGRPARACGWSVDLAFQLLLVDRKKGRQLYRAPLGSGFPSWRQQDKLGHFLRRRFFVLLAGDLREAAVF